MYKGGSHQRSAAAIRHTHAHAIHLPLFFVAFISRRCGVKHRRRKKGLMGLSKALTSEKANKSQLSTEGVEPGSERCPDAVSQVQETTSY